jgi:acyl-CoA reductase-like NAD-dependent aldehyde dehydrogenase
VVSLVLTLALPSYPYLVSINSVLPAIIAGNSVLLKPSPQTPLTAERFALALTRAGVPPAVIQVVHLSPRLTEYAIRYPKVDFVSFTGSVTSGKFVQEAASRADGFKGVALEVRLVLGPQT